MEMIQKILNTEEVSYTSTLKTEHLRVRIENLFAQKTFHLAGKVTTENEFTASDNLIVIGWDMPNLRRKSAYLKGQLIQSEKGTLVKLQVTPNSILPMFAVVATLIGIVTTFLTLFNGTNDVFSLSLGLVFIALGIIYFPVSTLLRNRLRNKLVKGLGLVS